MLNEQRQIVVIHTVGDDTAFTFFENESPYSQLQTLQIPTEHYEAAMVIKHEFTELHTNEKTLVFTMFSRNDHPKACKLLRFTRKEDEAGEVALPKRASSLKRPCLRMIA